MPEWLRRHIPSSRRPSDLKYARAAWRALRRRYLSRNPECVYCGLPATQVNHKVPVRSGGTDQDHNLEACCAGCHSRVTATLDGGGGRPVASLDDPRRRRPADDEKEIKDP